MSELKPCPFCGGEAEMYKQPHVPTGTEFIPRCRKSYCAGRLTKKWLNETAAIEAWNRRAE